MRFIEPTIEAAVTSIWRHKILFLLGIVLATGLAVAAYLATTPTYEASTSILVGRANAVDNEPGSAISTEIMNSQARIAESGEVVRLAISRIGLDAFPAGPEGALSGIGGKLRALLGGGSGGASESADPIPPLDVAALGVGRRMSVATEPNSNVLTIGFKDQNPARAAEMANALAMSFIDRQNELLERPGVVTFFRDQTNRFDEDVEKRAAAVREFAEREKIYSIEEQRSLLLHRKSDLEGALSAARSTLASKEGEKGAMARQLALLQPVARSPFALGFVEALDPKSVEDPAPGTPLTPDDTPPLLMIKIFQDVMASYRITDSEISGLRSLTGQQAREIDSINGELSHLAAKQSEYEKLKRDLQSATYNAETFAKRTVEEQIESDLLGAKLSNVRVIQPATIPLRAASPKGVVYLGFGLAFGLVLGVAFAFGKETYDLNRPGQA
ncbi:GumC family protein [Amaricoccus solimangrovi]|uniref:Polysaccharide chain length determinant N-terminal domain-containing protein n=1 Tax=Amaricoccus solimangrovi TaxID=2589815 RepID=A0A501WL28_9RHOB|nr:Wzz/FepE/Etk N-terminal domain-containing protein [Amaricoccus solimangrovi]TPE49115.1 hypothetical protein FJM51_15695 [Amaricoccus solimangrovi]